MRNKYWIIIGTAFAFIALVGGLVLLWFGLYGDEVFKEDVDPTVYITIGENGNWYISGKDTGILARGDDGFSPYVGANGNWWIGTRDTKYSAVGKDGASGKNGADGVDGKTPYIAENGNWWIGETDTGVKAEAKDGVNGTDGKNGIDGQDGKNGLTPEIGENGNWYIGGEDTGIKAEGNDGANGKDGKDGTNGVAGAPGLTPHIGENGNWYVGEEDTGVKAVGSDGINGTNGLNGEPGKNGITPHIGANGNWYIGEDDTGISAKGKDGLNGTNGTNGTNGAAGKDGADGNGIAEMKISEGSLYVRYTKDPGTWVNLGKIANSEAHSLKYYPLPDGTYAVGAGELLYSDEINISSEYDGKQISAIIPHGFEGATNLKSINIPDSIKEIGERAFSFTVALEEIVIPESVAKIGKDAFLGCENLTIKAVASEIPSSWAGFNPDGCAVMLGYIPNSDVFAGFRYEENAYGNIVITEYVGNERYVVIPEMIEGKEVAVIDTGAIVDKYDLLRITLPRTLKEIKDGAIAQCPKLLEIYNLSEFLTVSVGASDNGGIAAHAIAVHTSSSSQSVFIDSGDFIFTEISGAPYLLAYVGVGQEVVLPTEYNSAKYKVYAYALFGNTAVTKLTISSGVAEIGTRAFAECTAISEIVFDATECANLSSDANAFENSCHEAKVTIGKNAAYIPGYLFASTDASVSPDIVSIKLDEGTICSSVTSYAFYNLGSLRVFTLTQSLTVIEMKAFSGSGLTNIDGTSGIWSDGVQYYDHTSSEFVEVLKSSIKSFSRVGG